jgi:VWFA-related protein
MSLIVMVTDKSGKPFAGLTQSDFTLLDNNHATNLVGFHAYDGATQQSGPTTEAIILFDTVNTSFEQVSYARQQVESYLHQNGGHLSVPTSVYWFTNEGVDTQSEPTSDGNALATQVEAMESRLRTVNRSAGAYGAIERFQLSTRMLDVVAQNEAKKPGRKLLIWAGPGWPLLDVPSIDYSTKTQQALFGQVVELSTVLRQGHIDLYSVAEGMPNRETFLYQSFLKGVKKVNQASPPNLGLKVLAVQSGGLVIPPSNDLAASIAICMQDANVFYVLAFDPAPADGPNEYHDLKVKLDKSGLTARTNTGYYNQPGSQATR